MSSPTVMTTGESVGNINSVVEKALNDTVRKRERCLSTEMEGCEAFPQDDQHTGAAMIMTPVVVHTPAHLATDINCSFTMKAPWSNCIPSPSPFSSVFRKLTMDSVESVPQGATRCRPSLNTVELNTVDKLRKAISNDGTPSSYTVTSNTRKILFSNCQSEELNTSSMVTSEPSKESCVSLMSTSHSLMNNNRDDDLIGDNSGLFCLPTTHSRHQDLKAISPETVS